MAYGSPRSIDEVAPYFTDIRGGRTPSPEAVETLVSKYASIGGPSRLNEITALQASALQQLLDTEHPQEYSVYVGMKHWHPFISESVAEMAQNGIEEFIGLVLAPHFSAKSIGEYEERVRDAVERTTPALSFHMVKSWYDEPEFVGFSAATVTDALEGWEPEGTKVFFTAHSIPQRVVDEGDPYPSELETSARLIAEAAGVSSWENCWQSASSTGEPWIGPDILERLEDFASSGGKRALVAPIGFVSDHLEILFDVDIECVDKAKELGIELRRTRSPNDNSRFIGALGNIVVAAKKDSLGPSRTSRKETSAQ